MKLGATWGATPAERAASFPCDRLCDGADAAYYRAVTVRTDAERLFCWLSCASRPTPTTGSTTVAGEARRAEPRGWRNSPSGRR